MPSLIQRLLKLWLRAQGDHVLDAETMQEVIHWLCSAVDSSPVLDWFHSKTKGWHAACMEKAEEGSRQLPPSPHEMKLIFWQQSDNEEETLESLFCPKHYF